MSRAARWQRRLGVLGLLAVVACWKPGPPLASQFLFSEDFSTRCGALPCGWEQVAGTPGQARVTSSVHEGLRGIELAGADVLVRGPGGAPGTARLFSGALEAKLAARCAPGNTLVVRLAVAAGGLTDGGGARAFDTFEGRGTPADGTLLMTLTASTALAPGSPFAGGSGTYQVIAVTLGKSGSGTCTVDAVMVGDVGTTVIVPEPDCD